MNSITILWHVTQNTPVEQLAHGKQDAAFRTKPQIAMTLIEQSMTAGIAFRAIVLDCFYGDNNAFETALLQRQLPYVLARRGNVGLSWAAENVAHTFREAAKDVPTSAWHKVE